MPLTELWDDMGPVAARRLRDVAADDIRELLRAGRVRFVVADVGSAPRWVPEADCFGLWRSEVQGRVAGPAGAHLDDYAGGYCYFASEWIAGDGPPVVVLERAH